MTAYGEIKKNDALILHHKDVGYVRAWAMQEPEGLGGSALFRVTVNSPLLPGLSEAVINLNLWDVYTVEDPEVLKKIAAQFVKLEWER